MSALVHGHLTDTDSPQANNPVNFKKRDREKKEGLFFFFDPITSTKFYICKLYKGLPKMHLL